MSPLLGVDSAAPTPPADTWTAANVGDDVTGSVNELSATNVNITAAGTSDSTDDGTIAYQTVSSAQDIQIICKVPATYTGTVEDFTFFGVQIREALTGNPVLLSCLSANIEGGTKAKHRLTTDGPYVSYAVGETILTRDKYQAITYDHSESEARYWESDTGIADEFNQIGATVSITLAFPNYPALYGTSHNNAVTATAALANCSVSNTITISQVSPSSRLVGYVMDGTLSEFTEVNNMNHGMRLSNNTRTAESGTQVEISNGGGGVTTDCDSRMAVAGYTSPTNANGAGDTVNPRLNTYFLENRLNWKKDYNEINGAEEGDGGYPDDKPRCWNYPFRNVDVGAAGAMPVRWDETFWYGISIYVPSNWEHETLNVGNFNLTDWSLAPLGGATASQSQVGFSIYGKESGKSQWGGQYYVNAAGISDNGTSTSYDLGDLETDGDLGKWTDFVFKVRLNPFTSTTDASTISGGRNETYDGNRGILEIWKTVGAVDGNGDRAFVKRFSRVNLPVGNVPIDGYAPNWRPRIYKGGWNPTGTRDPRARSGIFGGTGGDDSYLFLGFDCFYIGDEGVHGTSFEDVNPGRLSEP